VAERSTAPAAGWLRGGVSEWKDGGRDVFRAEEDGKRWRRRTAIKFFHVA